jgi:hypothetical protein
VEGDEVAPDPQPDPRQRDPRQQDPRQQDPRQQGQQDPQFLTDEAPEGRQQSQPVMITGNMMGEHSTCTVGAVPFSAVPTVQCADTIVWRTWRTMHCRLTN